MSEPRESEVGRRSRWADTVTFTRRQVTVVVVVLFAAIVVQGTLYGQQISAEHRLSSRTAAVARQAEKLSRANRRLIREVERARVARRALAAQTDVLICRKINASNDILSDLLTRLTRLPPAPPTSPEQERARERALKQVAATLKRLKPQKCTTLPSARPTPPKPSP